MISRRTFLATTSAILLAAPLTAEAQQAGKVPRIGLLVLSSVESPEGRAVVGAFRQGLREHGYLENRNLLIEYRGAGGRVERIADLAKELVGLKVRPDRRGCDTFGAGGPTDALTLFLTPSYPCGHSHSPARGSRL